MLPMIPSGPPANITTEQIQKHLDENKRLILAILENQNLGRLAECAQYQAQLQKNLMYLAAIADAQPQAPSMPPQMAPQSVVQPGGQSGQYMQYPQAVMVQQPSGFSPRNPLQFNQERQHQLQLQQQSMQGPMSMRSGANNGMLAMHNETIMGGGSGASQPSSAGRSEFVPSGGGGGNTASGASGGSLEMQAGNKHDVLEVGSRGNGQGKPAAGQRTSDAEYRN